MATSLHPHPHDTYIHTALLPSRWNSWDFNGLLMRWLDLLRWLLSPAGNTCCCQQSWDMWRALSLCQLEYEGEKKYMAQTGSTDLDLSIMFYEAHQNHWTAFQSLSFLPAVPMSVCLNPVITNPVSPVPTTPGGQTRSQHAQPHMHIHLYHYGATVAWCVE